MVGTPYLDLEIEATSEPWPTVSTEWYGLCPTVSTERCTLCPTVSTDGGLGRADAGAAPDSVASAAVARPTPMIANRPPVTLDLIPRNSATSTARARRTASRGRAAT